LKVLPETCRVH